MSDQPAIPIGAKVRLLSCPDSGQPGTVLRIERGKYAVLWADIAPDYVSLHRAESLLLV
jgi:hypothetical protein